ncbi:ABC transporter ATP-binding protein [Ureaplasma miroungigenitalium]|uniref:ABC transporter ATP-binding protein n=1 Tax=Ureaplasma miroungigenitalium TaxID=1042321 RepID=A0ABT3BMJ9_9BACT|nr:ABC transporter ATP-binding protein [Ureaplasma miroungigenitalium]MCV3728468.1 ABC transporter ATP-binding protein [Ureaplasma miroungigenitalium]MCV3734255.1 ABC transporter ATP-binding protein [Ureaplasma miroungigenitalium]
MSEKVTTTPETKTANISKRANKKAILSSLDKEEKKLLKKRIAEIKKANKPHKGPIDIPMHDEENVIELVNVSKTFENSLVIYEALKDINISIKKGDFVIILGPSGSGKTTLMNIMSGLDRATSGDVRVCNKALINMKESQLTKFRKDNVGFVFQQYGLLSLLSVIDNVRMGADLQSDKNLRIDPLKALEGVGMLEYQNKYPNELSGGQQQRVSIARVLAKNPKIIFGDEPTGAVDETMSKMILNRFVEVNKELKTTIIIVTHNPIFADLGTLVVKVKDGRIHELIRNDNPKSVAELKWDS